MIGTVIKNNQRFVLLVKEDKKDKNNDINLRVDPFQSNNTYIYMEKYNGQNVLLINSAFLHDSTTIC